MEAEYVHHHAMITSMLRCDGVHFPTSDAMEEKENGLFCIQNNNYSIRRDVSAMSWECQTDISFAWALPIWLLMPVGLLPPGSAAVVLLNCYLDHA
jgi:hypothetical protein